MNLAGAGVALKGKDRPMASSKDVNRDGLPDLVVHFKIRDLELSVGDTVAVLEGCTFDGTPISGMDTIRLVPLEG